MDAQLYLRNEWCDRGHFTSSTHCENHARQKSRHWNTLPNEVWTIKSQYRELNSRATLCSPCERDWWCSRAVTWAARLSFMQETILTRFSQGSEFWQLGHACRRHPPLLVRYPWGPNAVHFYWRRHCQSICPLHAQSKFSKVYYHCEGTKPLR